MSLERIEEELAKGRYVLVSYPEDGRSDERFVGSCPTMEDARDTRKIFNSLAEGLGRAFPEADIKRRTYSVRYSVDKGFKDEFALEKAPTPSAPCLTGYDSSELELSTAAGAQLIPPTSSMFPLPPLQAQMAQTWEELLLLFKVARAMHSRVQAMKEEEEQEQKKDELPDFSPLTDWISRPTGTVGETFRTTEKDKVSLP